MALSQPLVARYAVYVKEIRDAKEVLQRRGYDVVVYDWRDGRGEIAYLQPTSHRGVVDSGNAFAEQYAGIRIYDRPPLWDIEVRHV